MMAANTIRTQGDIIGLALNMDDNEIKFYKNGSLLYTATSVAAGSWSVALTLLYTKTLYANFGQDSSFAGNETAQGNTDGNGKGDFYYAPPSGFLALCSANLPEVTIGPNSASQSDDHFNTVTYTGTGASATVGHGLSKVPEWIIVSNRGQNGGHNQFHSALGPTKTAPLQSYEPVSTSSNIWNDTAPTASVFSLGNNAAINGNNNTYVAYCFHGVDGYSKFGDYMGTGGNDGPFVHCGFRPAFIILKNTAAYQHYVIYDTKRSTSNLVDNAAVRKKKK